MSCHLCSNLPAKLLEFRLYLVLRSTFVGQLQNYMSDNHFTINTPLEVSITVAIDLMPLPSLPHLFVLQNRVAFSGLEWCYHSHILSNKYLSPKWIETSQNDLIDSPNLASRDPFMMEDLSWRKIPELTDDIDIDRMSWIYEGKDLVVCLLFLVQ